MENRRYCDPLLVEKDGKTHTLSRVPFDERAMQEGWLQELLARHPELLPVEEIEPAFAPLVTIGREIGTPAGAIDNLYVSPNGYVTLVETKLWRNPEARRQVVAQIIDYAKEVSQWDFEQLDTRVRSSSRQGSQAEVGILEMVRASDPGVEPDEAQFIDRVTRNLRRGRLLLIVAGDGIRESVEAMADYLQQTPQLQFTLALVELLTYRLGLSDGSLLVVPQVLARTREITRAVVKVEGTGIESVHVDVDTTTEALRPSYKRFTLAEEDFFDILGQNVGDDEVRIARQLISDVGVMGVEIDWRQASFSARLPDPGGTGQRFTLLLLSTDGGVAGGWLVNQLQKVGLPRRIAEEYFDRVAALFDNCRVKTQPSADLSWTRVISLSELGGQYDQFMDILADTIEQIKLASEAQG